MVQDSGSVLHCRQLPKNICLGIMLYSVGELVGYINTVSELVGLMLYSAVELEGMMLHSAGELVGVRL